MLICKACGNIVYDKVLGAVRPKPSTIPPDWSFVQLNTTGEFKQQSFTVVGRIRLQLRNDYKNFWSAALNDGSSIWIMESFASFALFRDVWHAYTDSISDVRANVVPSPDSYSKLRICERWVRRPSRPRSQSHARSSIRAASPKK